VWPTGATRVAGVIGQPIRHSLSPVLYNAAFRALELDWAFVAFEVAEGEGAGAVDAARVLGLDGLAVTMPHKAAVIPALDRLSPTAAALGSVNVIVREGSELVGDSTDGAGFLDALHADEGFEPAGRRCAVVGGGGAARAVVRALAEAGATEVVVINRVAALEAAGVETATFARRGEWPPRTEDRDLVVNATPLGTRGARVGETPATVERLRGARIAYDLVYNPARTRFIKESETAGCETLGGLPMLVAQAAVQFELWTEAAAPFEVMRDAAERQLLDTRC